MIFVIITATIGGLQIFTEPKLFNPTSANLGGAHREYQTTVLYLWDMAFNRGDFGKASAIAWLLFLIIVGIGLLNFLISRKIASAEVKVISKRRAKKLAKYRATTATTAANRTGTNPTTGAPAATVADEEKSS
jgi:cellobiose transport system permease protein